MVAGRRFGKTYLALVELLKQSINTPDQLCWYVAPTYKASKNIAWLLLQKLLPPEYIAIEIDKIG